MLDTCDAVYVCTWTSEHPRLVAAAVDRGLAVFCEKPLATNHADAAAMAELVDRAGATNQVGLILRRSPAYQWARHLITEPASGGVMSVVFRDDQFIPIQGHYSSTWRANRHLAGAGTLIEHSIHDVDMLRFLVGDVARVSAHTANFHGHDGIEDVASATLAFTNGATGTLTSIWHDNLARPSLRRVEVFCRNRFVVIEGDDWFGPVHWTDGDGTTGSLEGEALAAAVMVRLLQRTRLALAELATLATARERLEGLLRWTLQERLAGAVPHLPSTSQALRDSLLGHRVYVDELLQLSDDVGALIRDAKREGSLNADLDDEFILYTFYARSCDPTLDFLRQGGSIPDARIVDQMVAACFNGIGAAAPAAPQEARA